MFGQSLLSGAFGSAALGTQANPATSGMALYNAGIQTTGNYWINGGSGAYEAYIKMDAGGGWINVNLSNSVYSTLLSGGNGTGGSNMAAGGGSGTALLNANSATHAQANSLGCGGDSGKSYLDLNSTFVSDFSITKVRIVVYYVSDSGSVVCGPYWTSTTSSRTQLQGTSTELNGACSNYPNRYSDQVGTGFTVEFHGTLNTTTRLFQQFTACSGSYTSQLKEVYVK